MNGLRQASELIEFSGMTEASQRRPQRSAVYDDSQDGPPAENNMSKVTHGSGEVMALKLRVCWRSTPDLNAACTGSTAAHTFRSPAAAEPPSVKHPQLRLQNSAGHREKADNCPLRIH